MPRKAAAKMIPVKCAHSRKHENTPDPKHEGRYIMHIYMYASVCPALQLSATHNHETTGAGISRHSDPGLTRGVQR